MTTQQIADVRQLAQRYFDVVYRGDLSALDAAFSHNCELQTLADSQPKTLSLADYRELVGARELRHKDQNGVIEDIHITGDAIGCLRVRVKIADDFFTDYLSVLRFPDGWKIVAKVFLKH